MTDGARISMARYVGLFALIYIPLMILAAIVLNLIESKSSQGANVGCLAAASLGTAYLFVKKHRRPFLKGEYWTILAGSLAVDLLWQLVPAIPLFLAGKMTVAAYSIAVLFVGTLHGLFLAFMYSSRMVGKYVPKAAP